MGTRTAYASGTFSWTDLATSDPDGAKVFYGRLFGWQADDVPAGGGATYSLLRLDGDTVAGLYRQSEEERSSGVPPRWLCYVSVDRAREVTERAAASGATVVRAPFDVMDAGRMALLRDPGGATLALWEPRSTIGATRVNDPGCLCWNDLVTNDLDAAARFYGDVFGWEIRELPQAGGYWVIYNAGRTNGGLLSAQLAGWQGPDSWIPYYNAGELDRALGLVSEGGGRVVVPPQTVPAGRFSVAVDPQGATFALFEGDIDD